MLNARIKLRFLGKVGVFGDIAENLQLFSFFDYDLSGKDADFRRKLDKKSAMKRKSPTFGHCPPTFGHSPPTFGRCKPSNTKQQPLQARHHKPGTTKPQAEIGFFCANDLKEELFEKARQKCTENIAFSAFSGHIILKLAFCEDPLKKANFSYSFFLNCQNI